MTTLLEQARERPLVIAHRGASRLAPENTLDAFRAAIDVGCDAVELDVRRTADGQLVVHHAASRRGHPLAQLPYAELQRRSRHRPPRLAEVVALCAGRIAMDVELKEAGAEDAVVRILSQRFPAERLLVTSFHASVIDTVKRIAPALQCGLIIPPSRLRTRSGPDDAVRRALDCGADAVLPHHLLVPVGHRRLTHRREALVVTAAAAGLAILVWTVNAPRRMRRYLADPRIAGIITDVPDVALGTVRSLPRHGTPSSS